MEEHPAKARIVLSFGRFALCPAERWLTENGVPLDIGARTLDTLVALASRPNEVVGKRELMATVWPDVTVEEGSLRFHIAGLRKALGEGKDGARYIATLAGRGYCFVAPVTQSASRGVAAAVPEAEPPRATFLPARLSRMIGREDDIRAITAELLTSRFVTIVGPGGVGKTTVAVAIAHDLLSVFGGDVLFVDFGVLSEPRMVPASVASMLGLSIQSDDPVPGLIAFLRERRALVVLDTCEHVVEDAARFMERIFMAAPGLHILATSREALRVEGEHVHRLSALGVPPDDAAMTADAALRFPSAQLFVERAAASGARLDLGDAEATLVASICRRLDGMALAIELAAGRVESYGLGQIASLLDQQFTLLWPGQRTAPPRQKTLQATLEWSYGLLSERERLVFRQLAVFVGSFTIEAALAVVTSDAGEAAQIFAAIDSLVDKSMILAFPTGAMMRYRLLDIARAFARHVTDDRTEHAALAARHATYCLRWLEHFAQHGGSLLDPARRASYLVELNNVRAALAWGFSGKEHGELAISLAAAAAPVFFAMSLLTECQAWSQRAIAALEDGAPDGGARDGRALDGGALGTRREMRLQAALGLSLMWTRGNSEATSAALNRSNAIAAEHGDALTQILLLTPLHVFHLRLGNFRTAMDYAEQVCGLSRSADDPQAIALSKILLGFSHHFAGELGNARRELESGLRQNAAEALADRKQAPPSVTMKGDALAAPIVVLAASAAADALARTLWLQGHPTAAFEHVNRTLESAASANHPVTLLVALMYAISVLIWNGDLDEAGNQIVRFIATANSHALRAHVVLGTCFEGQLSISRGDTERGIEMLRTSLQELRSLHYELFTTAFSISLVEGRLALGRFDEGMSLVDAAIRGVETNGDFCYMPELLRLKAQFLRRLARPLEDAAAACLADALSLSRRQGALGWELRISIDLARRLVAEGRPERARALLHPVFDRFADGSNTADLRIARSLLDGWA